MYMGKEVIALLTMILIAGFANCEEENWPSKWRILALEGGGDKGSFQVGVLKAFAEVLKTKEMEYDVVTGVSVGSINAMAFALHEIGTEKKCINWMEMMWRNLTANDIYDSWMFGVTQGLFFEEGLLNNRNEIDFLANVFDEFKETGIRRKLEINTVDIDSGKVTRFNETGEWESFPPKVVASTAMPFAFPHLHYKNHTYVDGGSIWNIDISFGIKRCLETHSQKNIIIDVLLCDGLQLASLNNTQSFNTFQNYFRYLEFQYYYSVMSDLNEIIRAYPDVNWRYVVFPTEPLPTFYIPLGFNPESIREMIEFGYKDGHKVLEKYPKGNCDIVAEIVDKLHKVYDPETTKSYKNKM